MRKRANEGDLTQDIVEQAVRRALPSLDLRGVVVNARSSDHEEDPIYRIELVVAGEDQSFASDTLSSITGALLRTLEERGDDAFPIVYFRAPDEAAFVVGGRG